MLCLGPIKSLSSPKRKLTAPGMAQLSLCRCPMMCLVLDFSMAACDLILNELSTKRSVASVVLSSIYGPLWARLWWGTCSQVRSPHLTYFRQFESGTIGTIKTIKKITQRETYIRKDKTVHLGSHITLMTFLCLHVSNLIARVGRERDLKRWTVSCL